MEMIINKNEEKDPLKCNFLFPLHSIFISELLFAIRDAYAFLSHTAEMRHIRWLLIRLLRTLTSTHSILE